LHCRWTFSDQDWEGYNHIKRFKPDPFVACTRPGAEISGFTFVLRYLILQYVGDGSRFFA